ncbi:hypothetical protein [Priestia aryabhattai]|uniref:hypothetical protein n=1 Tax=Priestia aryabhattai TaxID=412384 RepID=UPI0015F72888|nr:hypothetical protein [Priestia aryabhattai]
MDKTLVKMAIDLYKGKTENFSKEQVNESLRKHLIELNGGQEKITDRSFRKHPELFEFLEETLSVLVSEGLQDQFQDLAEVRDVDFGQQPVFHIPDTKLFPVAVISDGIGSLRKQRIDNGELVVPTKFRGIAIYEELTRVLAGRTDWVEMVQRVAKSYNQKIATEVYDAIYNSFDQLTAPFKTSGTYAEGELLDLTQHVEAESGADVVIFGTKKALSKIKPSEYSDAMLDRKNETGFLRIWNGYEMREIKQAHKAGSYDFAISDNFLLVVPTTQDKFVKIVNEGETRIIEESGLENQDFSQGYTFLKKAGVSIVTGTKYGIYRLA